MIDTPGTDDWGCVARGERGRSRYLLRLENIQVPKKKSGGQGRTYATQHPNHPINHIDVYHTVPTAARMRNTPSQLIEGFIGLEDSL